MSNEKYLSDVITVDDIMNTETPGVCVFSGVGSGKNYFVEKVLAKTGNVFYVSSRRAKVDEILTDGFGESHINWASDIIIDPVVMTFSGVEKILKSPYLHDDLEKIMEFFKYIVIDEAHALATDSTYADSTFHVLKFIEYALKKEKKVILMTGTPEPLMNYISSKRHKENWTIIDCLDRCKNVRPKEIHIISKKRAYDLLSDEKKAVYMTNSATGIFGDIKTGKNGMIPSLVSEYGLKREEIFFWISKNADALKKCDVSEEEKEQNNELINKMTEVGKIPDGIRLLLCTSTLREGINIEDGGIKNVYCESHLLEDIQQFAGRFRKGIDCIYLIKETQQYHRYSYDILQLLLVQRYLLDGINQFYKNYYMGKDKISSKIFLREAGYTEEEIINWFDVLDASSDTVPINESMRKDFIDIMQNLNEFIKFNYAENIFDVWVLKGLEEKRQSIYYKKGWLESVKEYCEENGIDFVDETIEERQRVYLAIVKYLETVVDMELRHECKTQFRFMMSKLMNHKSDKPQIGTINEFFDKYSVPYYVIEGSRRRLGHKNADACLIVKRKEIIDDN